MDCDSHGIRANWYSWSSAVFMEFCQTFVHLGVCEVALERALAENQAKSYFVQHPQKLCPGISWQTGVWRVSGSLYSVLFSQGSCHWLPRYRLDGDNLRFGLNRPKITCCCLAIPFIIPMISHHLSHTPWGNKRPCVGSFCTRLRKLYRNVFGHV